MGGDLYYKDDDEALATLLKAFDSGINFYDTSDIYCQGQSESLIGRAFKGKRDKVIIATKGGILFTGLGTFALKIKPFLKPLAPVLSPFKRSLVKARDTQKKTDFSPEHLTKAIHGSLKRLQTDYLDVFQLHYPNSSMLEKGDFCETLDKLKSQGKIRYYGVSCNSSEDTLISLKHPGVSSVQIPINLLDQEAITKVLPDAQKKNSAVIARVPLAQGLFTETKKETMAERFYKDKEVYRERKRKAEGFRFLIKEDRTLAQAALQFILQLKSVSVVIPGMINRTQLAENLATLGSPPLTDVELKRIYSSDEALKLE